MWANNVNSLFERLTWIGYLCFELTRGMVESLLYKKYAISKKRFEFDKRKN